MAAAAESPRFIGGYAEGMELDYRGRAARREGFPRSLLKPLNRWLAREPHCAEAWAWRGAVKRRLLDYAGAVADLNRAWALGLRSPTILTWRGEAKFQIGRGAEGLADFASALKRRPQAWHYAWSGRVKLTVGHDAAGLKDLDRAVAADPGDGWLLAWRAEGRRRLGRFGGLEKDFAKALRLDESRGHRAMILCWRGLSRLDASRLPGALSDFNACLRVLPDYPTALRGRSELQRRRGRLKAWIADFEKACRLSPNLLQHLYRLEGPELESWLADLRALNTRPAWTGFILLRLGRVEEALAELANPSDAKDAQALLWRAEALLQSGDSRAALRDLARALRIEPRLAAGWALRARAHLALGKTHEALANFDRSLSLDPSAGPVHAARGGLLLLLGCPQRAAADLRRALHYDSRNAQALADLSVACARGGAAAEGRRALHKARSLDARLVGERLRVWRRHFRRSGGQYPL